MFQLAPVTLKPEIRASRTQHGQFQSKIASLVDSLISETEILDMEHKQAKQLFNALDTFFSYGLLSGNKIYWAFVREFLPKTEQLMLRAEWGNVNDRRLSLAWLKDAFNKNTLYFQMMAFRTNKRIITRFYHANACLSNGGMLEAVTEMMGKLEKVQFAFYSRLNLRMEPVPAVVIQAPISLNTRVARARRRRETEGDHDGPTTENVQIPSTIQEAPFGTPADQDLILDELVRSRRNRLQSERFSFDKEDPPDSGVHTQVNSTEPPTEERFDDVLRKTMSQVRMEHLSDEPKSFDSLLHLDEMKIDRPPEEELHAEGEDILNPGDILQLAIDVFVEQGEKLLKMYHVYETFAVGVPLRRLLAVTDHNIYIVSKTIVMDDSPCAPEGSSNHVYHAHTIIPLGSIDYIAVSVDHQVLVFYAKEDDTFNVIDNDKISNMHAVVCIGEKALGAAIIKSIENATQKSDLAAPVVFTESNPYSLLLKRYLSKELSTEPNCDIYHMSLVYWKESSAIFDQQTTEHSGYLYWRFNQPNWWRKPPTEYEQSFFLLPQDRKLYVFTDSTMKEGVIIYDLRKCTETLEMDQKKDSQWSIELVFPEGNMQLLSQSKEELCRWLQMISSAITQPEEDNAAASMVLVTGDHLVVAQEGNKCMVDGFVRTLMSFALTEIQSGWIVRSESHMVLLLKIDSTFQWFFFRSEHELDRLVGLLSNHPIPIDEIAKAAVTRETSFIINTCNRAQDLWYRPVYDQEVEEVLEN